METVVPSVLGIFEFHKPSIFVTVVIVEYAFKPCSNDSGTYILALRTNP